MDKKAINISVTILGQSFERLGQRACTCKTRFECDHFVLWPKNSIGRSKKKNGSGTNFLVEIPSPACAEMVFIVHQYFHKNHGPQ